MKTPEEMAKDVLGASDIYGIDRWDAAEQKADALRRRIRDAIRDAVEMATYVLIQGLEREEQEWKRSLE